MDDQATSRSRAPLEYEHDQGPVQHPDETGPDEAVSADLTTNGSMHSDGTQIWSHVDDRLGLASDDLWGRDNGAYSVGADHMLFDSAFDIQAQNDDLDWLFGTFMTEGDTFMTEGDLDGTHAQGVTSNTLPSSVSPSSTILQPSPGTHDGASDHSWFEVRGKLHAALYLLSPEVLQSSFFDPVNLQRFYQLYLENYHSHFPILHKATLMPARTPPLLLTAVLTLGATLSSDTAHFRQAQQVLDSLRWQIFSSEAFQPPAPMWCIQALLLVQAQGKMFSTRKHHEMAHIFHASLITLMRRGSSYSNDYQESSVETTLEKAWHAWIERESSKRASFFAFIMDAQHSSIFGHVPALSISDMRLVLPCSEALWDAKTASKWKRERAAGSDDRLFLPTLRALLGRQPLPQTLSPFSRFCVLHGLFSVTKHMQMRDILASDMDAESVTEETASTASGTDSVDKWYEVLDRAIETWSLSLLSQEPSLCLEAARPLQRMAHVSIHVNLTDFHVLAGAPSLTGNGMPSLELERAQARVRHWACGPRATRTLSQCLLLVQETMFVRRRYRATEDNIALRPWCLYHATLVLWAYGAITRPATASTSSTSAEEYVVQMLNELMGGSDRPSIAHNTNGLIAAVHDALVDCRWELLQEANSTLARLTTQT